MYSWRRKQASSEDSSRCSSSGRCVHAVTRYDSWIAARRQATAGDAAASRRGRPPTRLAARVSSRMSYRYMSTDGRVALGHPLARRGVEGDLDARAVQRVALDQGAQGLVDVMDHRAAQARTRARPAATHARASLRAPRLPDRADARSPCAVRACLVARPRAQRASPPVRSAHPEDVTEMPNYLSPGVYVEEVEAGSRPIEGVGTAIAAFVGLAAHGPDQRADPDHQLGAVRRHLWRLHGRLVPGPRRVRLLPQRRRLGLRRAHRRRLAHAHGARRDRDARTTASFAATASARSSPGPIGNQITVEITEATDAADDTFKLTVSAPGSDTETTTTSRPSAARTTS